MRVYEKDTQIKIPSCFTKLPQKSLNRLSDFGIAISRFIPKKRTRKQVGTTNFYF